MMNDVLVFIVGYATGMISCVLIIFTLMKKPKGNQELGSGSIMHSSTDDSKLRKYDGGLNIVVDNDGGIQDGKNE